MDSISPKFTNDIFLTSTLKAKLKSLGYSSTTFEGLILEVIEKSAGTLAEDVKNLKAEVAAISTDTLPANAVTAGLGTGSVDAVKLVNRSVDYSVSDNTFTYSFDNLKKDLPTGFQAVTGSATVTDVNGKKSSVKGLGSTVKVSSTPAKAQVSVTVLTENGTLELKREIVLQNGTGSAVLDVNDLTTAPADLKQKQFNDLIAAEVAALKQRL